MLLLVVSLEEVDVVADVVTDKADEAERGWREDAGKRDGFMVGGFFQRPWVRFLRARRGGGAT